MERKPIVQTIKLRGRVEGVHVLLLLDTGATHNFISKKLVTATGLAVQETIPVQIEFANGYKTRSTGECKLVKVDIDALVFDLDEVDTVLSMAWLNSIGGMWVDWPQQIMCFQFNQEQVELKGENSSEMVQMALKSLLGWPKQWDKGCLMVAEGFPLVPKSDRDAVAEIAGKQAQELQKVLDEFLECREQF